MDKLTRRAAVCRMRVQQPRSDGGPVRVLRPVDGRRAIRRVGVRQRRGPDDVCEAHAYAHADTDTDTQDYVEQAHEYVVVVDHVFRRHQLHGHQHYFRQRDYVGDERRCIGGTHARCRAWEHRSVVRGLPGDEQHIHERARRVQLIPALYIPRHKLLCELLALFAVIIHTSTC